MKKNLVAAIIICILIISVLVYKIRIINNGEMELIEISSKRELEAIYNHKMDEIGMTSKLLTLPFSILADVMTKTSSIDGMITNSSKNQSSDILGSDIKAERSKYRLFKRIFNNKYTSRECR